MARRRRTPVPAAPTPQYAWAFDAEGRAIPIADAVRGGLYHCPLCQGRMVARLGGEVRHHFAHEALTACPADEVARAAAVRWLLNRFQDCLTARQVITTSWTCPLCGQVHGANLLAGVVSAAEHVVQGDLLAGVGLLGADGALRAGVVAVTPDVELVAAYDRAGTPLIVINPAQMWRPGLDLPALLSGATIYGGLCVTRQAAVGKGIIADEAGLRRALLDGVTLPPHRFFGPLDAEQGLEHVLVLGRHRLWLPPAVWLRVVGGVRHVIAPGVSILSQEWPRLDDSTVALYYVSARQSHAVAVRRFAPGEMVTARLADAAFRTPRMSVLQLARSLAEG
jgi:hypothetical protein